ncbi:MAG: leucine-rich repeat protein [Rikenellaceae bacterium]
MMKKISLLAFAAVAFVGCSKESIDELIAPSTITGRELTVAASFGSTGTRIGLAEDDSYNWNFTWQEDDMLGAQFDKAAVSANVPFYIQDEFSGNSAEFTGAISNNAEKVVFTYPHRVTDFDLRNQIVVFDNESKALNAYGEYYAVLISEELSVSDLENGTITNIPLSAKYTAIELEITGSADVTGTITKAIMSYTSEDGTTTTNLSVTNAPALSANKAVLIPFSYEPFTTDDDDSFTVTCIFADGKVATFTNKDFLEGVAFAAGTHNYMSVRFSEYATSGVYSDEISSYSADSYPTTGIDIWVVTDSEISSADEYDGLKAALVAAKTAGRTIELVFPNLTTVVASAFYQCTSLTTISLPAAITFENGAFRECPNLTSVSLPAAQTFETNAFRECPNLTSVSLPAAQTFGNYALSGCSNLTSISLPVATEFGKYAFYECTSLTSVSLPKAETFGNHAFSSCTSLTSVSLPVAQTFENNAFYGCTSLTTISLGVDGDGISSIGTNFCSEVTISDTDLTIKLAGESNCSIVDKTITITNSETPVEYTFKSITQ